MHEARFAAQVSPDFAMMIPLSSDRSDMAIPLTEEQQRYYRDLEVNFDRHVGEYRAEKLVELAGGAAEALRGGSAATSPAARCPAPMRTAACREKP